MVCEPREFRGLAWEVPADDPTKGIQFAAQHGGGGASILFLASAPGEGRETGIDLCPQFVPVTHGNAQGAPGVDVKGVHPAGDRFPVPGVVPTGHRQLLEATEIPAVKKYARGVGKVRGPVGHEAMVLSRHQKGAKRIRLVATFENRLLEVEALRGEEIQFRFDHGSDDLRLFAGQDRSVVATASAAHGKIAECERTAHAVAVKIKLGEAPLHLPGSLREGGGVFRHRGIIVVAAFDALRFE